MDTFDFFLFFHSFLFQAQQCADKNLIHKYRKLTLFLALLPNRFLPIDTARLLLSLGKGDYNTHSADANIKRLLDKKVISASPRAYLGRYTLYALTPTGFEQMLELLIKASGREMPFMQAEPKILKEIFDSHRFDPPTAHSIAESITYCQYLLLFAKKKVLSLDKEVQYDICRGNRIKKGKTTKNLVSDISFTYPTGSVSQKTVCCEVDLLTERVSGSNSIHEKGLAYSELAAHIGEAVVFAVFDDGWVPRHSPSETYSEKEVRAFSGYLAPFYFSLSLLDLALQYKFPGKQHTVADAIAFLQAESIPLNKNISRDKGQQYGTLLTLLEATARTVPPFSDIPMSGIRNAIDMASHVANQRKESAQLVHYQETYQRRRLAIYRMICKGFSDNCPIRSVIGRALAEGMMFACYPGRLPEQHLPWLLPELFFQDDLPQILFNLGIVMNRCPVETVGCLPLRGREDQDAHGASYNGFGIFSRCAYKIGALTVCIENASDDIGGFVRVKEYLKLPPGSCPNTIMIVLVNNDRILADGSHANHCTLFYQGYLNGKNLEPDKTNTTFTDWGTAEHGDVGIVGLYANYLHRGRAINDGTDNNCHLPYVYKECQDVAMLTYKEFQTAATKRQDPWIMLPDDCGSIKLTRGPSSHSFRLEHCAEP